MDRNNDKHTHSANSPNASNHEGFPPDDLSCAHCDRLHKLAAILRSSGVLAYEYVASTDLLIAYDEFLKPLSRIPHYLSALDAHTQIHPDDRAQLREFFCGARNAGTLEVRSVSPDGHISRKMLCASPVGSSGPKPDSILFSVKDVTQEKEREQRLAQQAMRDALTGLYNRAAGKELINDYLYAKNPYASCGLMLIDIDYFKSVNDIYGHPFGDTVLIALSRMLERMFRAKDILVRVGGDEFVVFLKDISHASLLKKAMQLIHSVRDIPFEQHPYSMTLSVGVCFLPENAPGYTFDQLFENADWALYRAKEEGKNRYAFCDTLHRFELAPSLAEEPHPHIDARYLHGDIISTAFEIFDKLNGFDAALSLLLEVIGIRFQLDRITIMRIDIKERCASRLHQWKKEGVSSALDAPAYFTKEDFLSHFHSYDEYGTTVLQADELFMFSPETAQHLVQAGAKTSVYSAMYCEGQYTGAIVYVTCEDKRFWSKQYRNQLGELTKLISAHMARNRAMNSSNMSAMSAPEYDSLTGLLSIGRFREEVERLIVGGYAASHVMVYFDFARFRAFNQKCGYSTGDQLLREFAAALVGALADVEQVYFTRIVSDQFLLFMPCEDAQDYPAKMQALCDTFIARQSVRFPEAHLRLRAGIYFLNAQCIGASQAIDAANYARKQVTPAGPSIQVYTDALAQQQSIEKEILGGMGTAMAQHEFKIYLQPKFSIEDFSLVGAEALVRWKKRDGSLLTPDAFLPLYEESGSIIALDFYVFEQVAALLARNAQLGRRQVPISINASILHAADDETVPRYLSILNKYGVDPSLTEIELTETATVSDYDNVKKLFKRLQEARFKTSLDDFGAGYSVLNTVIDIPVNTMKLDRALINSCQRSEKGVYFLRQLITLVKGLGYQVVCEGVETDTQVDILKQVGCDIAQGYWFSHPLPVEEYEKLLCTPDAFTFTPPISH